VEFKSTGEPTLLESTLIDCLLPALLTGIASVPELADNLVLKGGSALRQFYFPEARFSNDLDFSALGRLPESAHLTLAVHQAAQRADQLLAKSRGVSVYALEIEGGFKPVAMRSFQFVYEWKPGVDVRIGLEISLDERIVRVPRSLPAIAAPDQECAAGCVSNTLVYDLDEIAAEKLRALLQWTRQLKEKGRRNMPVARTYFDLHYLLKYFSHRCIASGFTQLLKEKCRVRAVSFSGADSFFDAGLVDVARTSWQEQLSCVMAAPPQPEELLAELEEFVASCVFCTDDIQ